MKKIRLNNGIYTLVDDDLYPELSKYKWYVHTNPGYGNYAHRESGRKGKSAKVIMHRVITKAPRGTDVDHLDGNGLNNQRSNLRVCSHSDNMRNTYKHRQGKLYGTTLHRDGKYQAQVWNQGRQKYLGLFETEKEAAEASNKFLQGKTLTQHHEKAHHS